MIRGVFLALFFAVCAVQVQAEGRKNVLGVCEFEDGRSMTIREDGETLTWDLDGEISELVLVPDLEDSPFVRIHPIERGSSFSLILQSGGHNPFIQAGSAMIYTVEPGFDGYTPTTINGTCREAF